MGLSGKVHDGVNVFGYEEEIDEVSTSDVTLDKLEIAGRAAGKEVLEVRAVIKLIKHHNVVLWVVADQTVCHMRGNEACCTRN